jgi:hypothetical protein
VTEAAHLPLVETAPQSIIVDYSLPIAEEQT